MSLVDKKRIVIKVGSSLLVENGQIKARWLESLAADVLELKKHGKEVLIVSSGAIALGKAKLGHKNKILKLEEKQASAAIGQIFLMSNYQSCFSKLGINVAQILLTDDDSANRNRYLNARNTFNALLANNIVPIVNENDTITTNEIKIGDNDRLAARIAQIITADLLILLSDIDGLYSDNPKINPDAKFIELVKNIDDKIEEMASGSISEVGTGGMITKIKAAKMAFNLGCTSIIANGLTLNPIQKIINGSKCTIFKPANNKKINARKQWIADCLNVKGEAIINNRAGEALLKGSSLLPVGVVKISGQFAKGDVISIKNEQEKLLANGISRISSALASEVIGKNNQEELIHRNDLVMID
jgi:glutamate 5-kinase